MIDFKSESVKNLLLAAIDSKGYKEDAKKTSKRHRVFKDGSNDTIVVSANAHFQLYYNPGISDDKGDVISFLLNRAGIGVNCKNHLSAHFKQIEGELEKLGAYNFSREYLPIERKPFNWSEHKPFVSNFTENVPGNILALLENRFINPAVLFDPDLQPVQKYKNNKTGYSNIFFPFLDINGNVVGGQFKYLRQNEHGYQTVKMNLPDSERERSLWHTNGTGKKCLFIVEDPFDAIAFKLLYPNCKYQLSATGGSITNHQISQIRNMSAGKRLVLGNDFDFSGLFANLSIIEGKQVNRQVDKNGTATFRIEGEEELKLDLTNLKDFVMERAKKSDIEVLFPIIDDWNEMLKQKKQPSRKLADVTNTTNHAGKVTQGISIHKHI